MERTEAYKNCIKDLKDLSIRELKEISSNIDCYWDEYNEKELSKEDYIEAIKETLFFKFDALDQKAIAAAKYFETEPDEVELENYDHHGLDVYSYGHEEVAVGNEDEADEAAAEEIRGSLWAFNAEFIAEHTSIGYRDWFINAIKVLQEAKCEDANDNVLEMIEDIQEFIDDAITADGRGTFLSPYDSEENEIEVDSELFFVYRIN